MSKAIIPGWMCIPGFMCLTLLAFCHPAGGQSGTGSAVKSSPAQKPNQDKSDKAELDTELAKSGITVDWKKQIIRAKGKINIRNDFLEYIAIGPRGKKHEALVVLECKGSRLAAALMGIGYKGGKNVDYKPVVPLPTEEQVRQGARTSTIVPPTGPVVYLALEWKDEKKNTVRYALEDLLIDMQADGPIQKAEWIYFGGITRPIYRGEPPVFVADYDQNYISNYYVKPDSHLITLRHARARDDQNWWPHTERLPERGTPCILILSKAELVKRRPAKKPDKKDDKKPDKKDGKNGGDSGKGGK